MQFFIVWLTSWHLSIGEITLHFVHFVVELFTQDVPAREISRILWRGEFGDEVARNMRQVNLLVERIIKKIVVLCRGSRTYKQHKQKD